MKNVEFLMAGVVATALLSGCSSAEIPENQTSPNDAQMEQYFNQVRDHWKKVGQGDVGRIASTNLVTLREADDAFTCYPVNDFGEQVPSTQRSGSSDAIAQLCSQENIVILREDKLTREAARTPSINYKLFVAAHEFGHAVAEARKTSSALRVNELIADCYAGSALAATAPHEIPSIVKFYNKESGGIARHGSGAEIAAAVQAGAQDTTGKKCDDY